MEITFEDNFEDVLAKAAVGQKLGHKALAEATGLDVGKVRAVMSGDFDALVLRAIGEVLDLNPNRLVQMAVGDWTPEAVNLPGLKCVNMPFPEAGYAGANASCFVVYNEASKEALIFDTGVTAEPILEFVRAYDLNVQAILLTHTHRDHVGGYAGLIKALGAVLSYAPENEPYEDAKPVSHGMRLELAGFSIEVRLTNGHTPGGVTYVVSGLQRRVAIVGDSIFSLSMGGAKRDYAKALANNREQVLSLPGDTVLCPGHGPMTSVGEELAHNPFFNPDYANEFSKQEF